MISAIEVVEMVKKKKLIRPTAKSVKMKTVLDQDGTRTRLANKYWPEHIKASKK